MPAIDNASPVPVKVKSEIQSEDDDDMDTEETNDEKRRTPSPSPAVVDHRTPKEKLDRVVSSYVVPYETTSSNVSEIQQQSETDTDDVVIFEGQQFHYLDPYEMIQERQPQPTLVPSMCHEHDTEEAREEGSLFSVEQMDAMMAKLKEPGGIWSVNVNDMDDEAFGNVLESLVIDGTSVSL